MEKFEIGKVYACGVESLRINDYYEDYNDIFDEVKIEIAYEDFFSKTNNYTLLVCIDNSEKTLFKEYYTQTKVTTYPVWSQEYSFNNKNYYKTKKEILNRPLLYISKHDITEIDDDVLKKLYLSKENGVKEEINKGIDKSRTNLYVICDRTLKALIRQSQCLAEAENMVRHFETEYKKPKSLGNYTC